MRLQNQLYLVLAWCGIALIGVAAVVMAVRGDWLAAAVLLLFLGLSVAFVLLRRALPNLFDLLFVLASMVNAAGYVWDLFTGVVYYDEVAHAFTSFALAMALGFLVYRTMALHFAEHGWLFVIAAASLALSLGVLWEIFEFYTGLALDIRDTITDLIADTLGALAGGLVAAREVRRRA